MLLYRMIVTLGVIMSTNQKQQPPWNSEKDLHDHANFIESTEPRSHLTKLDVVCGKDHMTVNMQFDSPFHGVVFSQSSTKDHERCIHVRPQSGVLHATFDISYFGCGTVEDLRGQFHENTIIVQFGEDILEAWDEAKRLRCEWLESFDKPSSNQALHISDIDAVELNFQGDDVDCWMEIQDGKGPWARPVAGLIPLGSPLTVVIAINDNSREFDMRVKQCDAHDEKGFTSIKLTDEDGCVLRSTLLTPFVKVRDFGGKATLVAYSHFFAFKFPDHLDVYIRCVVEVCRHGCLESCPEQSIKHEVVHPRKPVVSPDYPQAHNKNSQHAVLVNSIKSESQYPGRNKHPASVGSDELYGHNPNENSLSNLLNQLQNADINLQKHKLAALVRLASEPTPLPAPPIQDTIQIQGHRIQNVPEPQPEPNSFAHPHHITTEELERINLKAAPQPEPNSFAHPHHISTEQLESLKFNAPQPEPNSFAHPHHITTEQLQAGALKNAPLPEPNSFAHPHHITTEQLQAAVINNVPQPKPNSFTHPHHITSEQLHAVAAKNVPQPEPNSFAHPHHLTTEQFQAKKEHASSQQKHFPFTHQHQVIVDNHRNQQHNAPPQPEPNSFAHPHHITSEEFQAITDNTHSESNVFPNFHSSNEDKPFNSQTFPPKKHIQVHPEVISVTLVPNGEMVFKYAPQTSSTIPQPTYISSERFIPYNTSQTFLGAGKSFLQQHAQSSFIDIPSDKLRPHNPYPVPQFSPRAQQMLGALTDGRSNEKISTYDHNRRTPVTDFYIVHENEEPTLKKVPHGPRLLRTKRSQPVFGVQQKFRAIAPADLAFDWNATADYAAVFRGRREEIIYGVCLSTAKFSVTLSLMLFITLCSSIVSAFLFQRSQILQKKMKSSSTSSTLFNGQVERVYSVGHTNLATDIIEIS